MSASETRNLNAMGLQTDSDSSLQYMEQVEKMEKPTWRPATSGDLNAMGLQTDRRQLTTKQVELMGKPTWHRRQMEF
jgi:hypothetical protein